MLFSPINFRSVKHGIFFMISIRYQQITKRSPGYKTAQPLFARTMNAMRDERNLLPHRHTLPPENPPVTGKPFIWAVLAIMTAFLLFLSACGDRGSKKGKGKGEKPPAPVTVAGVRTKKIPVEMTGTGHVEAGLSVNVLPRVSGKLLSVHFREGADVKKGDLLFSLDPAPFKAKLDQARADLERDRAKRNLAAKQVKRYSGLTDKGYLSTEEYEQLQNDVAVLDATIRSDQAAVETARLDLSYCSVRADISGVAGEIAVDPGNLVTPNASAPLTTLREIRNLDVSFSLPETHLREIRSAMDKGRVTVTARSEGAKEPLSKGVLTFIDNAIDSKTGTVMLKGRFENESKTLWPGQFVQVVVELPVSEEGLAVPSQAVQTGQKGSYVYVLRQEKKVEARDVMTGRSFNGDTLITKGLSEGEKVVVEGQLKLAPGAMVKIIEPGREKGGSGKPGDVREPKNDKAGQP
jgi:multidrug efflux system membrane fusion protein